MFNSLLKAFLDMFRPRILLLLFIPAVLSFSMTGIVAWLAFDPLKFFLLDLTAASVEKVPEWVFRWLDLSPKFFIEWGLADKSAMVALAVVFLPFAVVLSFLLVSSFASWVINKHVRLEYYPELELKGNPSLAFSLGNTIKYSLVYILLYFLTIPLMLIPGSIFGIFLLLNKYITYKIGFFDSLSDIATKEEMRAIKLWKRDQYLALAFIVSLLLTSLIFFIVAPVYIALVFSHYSLRNLKEVRAHIEARGSRPV